MENPWNMIKPDTVTIVDPSGNERGTVKAFHAGKTIIVDDIKAHIEPGDKILRPLPNGRHETFIVDELTFYDVGGIPPHYQIKFHRPNPQAHKETMSNISITGSNARVNINSTDNSHNYLADDGVFERLRENVTSELQHSADIDTILLAIENAQKKQGTAEFKTAYQDLVASLANHATILAPFLPALSQML